MDSKLGKQIEKLPKTSGVYLMHEKREIIYIGKAINIRSRVKNHFLQPSYRDNLFINKVTRVRFLETASEIEALILEANLIKKHLPKFNVVWKDDKNYFYLAIAQNQDGIPYIYITHQPTKVSSIKYQVSGIRNTKYSIQNTHYIGPFVEGNPLKKTLKYLRRVFPFYTVSRHPKNQCTWCHLGLCPGPNPDAAEYKKSIKKLVLIFRGNSKKVVNALKKEMAMLSKENKFEEAARKRDQLRALENIMAHTHVIANEVRGISEVPLTSWRGTAGLLQKILGVNSPIARIECFDISNIQGKNAVGSMVVFNDGSPDKSQYKKFRIKWGQESRSQRDRGSSIESGPNDIAMLKEVISRRLSHPEWPYPEVMLIDGGKAQLNVAIQTKNKSTLFPTAVGNRVLVKDIKIISIAKGRQELFIEGRKQPIPLKNLPQEVYNVVKHLDDEAHRFAITYHQKLRKKVLFTK